MTTRQSAQLACRSPPRLSRWRPLSAWLSAPTVHTAVRFVLSSEEIDAAVKTTVEHRVRVSTSYSVPSPAATGRPVQGNAQSGPRRC